MREEALIPMVLFASMAVVIWKAMSIRHEERMDMLARGFAPSELKGDGRFSDDSMRALKWGLILTCGGGGFLLGLLIQNYVTMDIEDNPMITFSSALISGGMGMLIYYRKARAILAERRLNFPNSAMESALAPGDVDPLQAEEPGQLE